MFAVSKRKRKRTRKRKPLRELRATLELTPWIAAPITVSRNLLLTPVEGGAAAAESASTEWVAPPKVKRAQPEHKFKFRNCVAGFDTAGPGATAEAVAAAASVAKPKPAAAVESSPESAAKKPKLDKEKRSKKRKSDVDGTPSKKKKKE